MTTHKITFGKPVGGYGTAFQGDLMLKGNRLAQIKIRSGNVINNIQTVYHQTGLSEHGDKGGDLTIIDLADDEHITELEGFSGVYAGEEFIVQLQIKTNKKTYGPYGKEQAATNTKPFKLTRPAGEKVVAFNGSTTGHNVSSLGIGTRAGTGPITFGKPAGGSGTPFQDDVMAGNRLTQIRVRSGDVLDNIKGVYCQENVPDHGGHGGVLATIDLATDEYVTQLDGHLGFYFGAVHITQLHIKTNKKTYGPYGDEGSATDLKPFSMPAPAGQKIVAFNGGTLAHSEHSCFISSIGIGTC